MLLVLDQACFVLFFPIWWRQKYNTSVRYTAPLVPDQNSNLVLCLLSFFFHLLNLLFRFISRMRDLFLFFVNATTWHRKETTSLDQNNSTGPRPDFPFSIFNEPLSGLEQRSSTYSSCISPQLMYPRRHHVAQSKGPRPITALSDLDHTYAFLHFAIPWHKTKRATTQNNSVGPRPNHSSTRYGLQKITLLFLERNK